MGQRFSLLGKFSGLSLLAMVLLGLTLGLVLQDRIEARALKNARELTEVFSRVAVGPNVNRADLAAPLSPEQVVVLDRALAGIRDSDMPLINAHLFGADGTTVYSTDRGRVGQVADGADFKAARSGRLVSNIEREVGDDGEHVATSLE